MQWLIFVIVVVTALGIVFQCLSNRRAQHVQFLSFPIAVLIQLPYPMWAVLAWFRDNTELLAITCLMGLPTAWLSAQYFRYHGLPSFDKGEDRLTLILVMLGLLWCMGAFWVAGAEYALASTAAYFTCVISIFSYLVKIVRVAMGQENLEGLRWPTLMMLFVFYLAMLMVGQRTGVPMLYYAYLFSVFACGLAVFYKAWHGVKTEA
ncbi:MAG: hypothetical protein C9356_18225 [Oleiphilus sp.]|nr:MAG: hypothetical protein C9356_18225 [Oleiphilus sp.]